MVLRGDDDYAPPAARPCEIVERFGFLCGVVNEHRKRERPFRRHTELAQHVALQIDFGRQANAAIAQQQFGVFESSGLKTITGA